MAKLKTGIVAHELIGGLRRVYRKSGGAADRLAGEIRGARKRRPPLAEAPSLEGKRIVFIGGMHRSGTSILHSLLRENPAVSGFFDTGAKQDEGQHLQTVFPPAKHYGGPGRFGFHPEAYLTEASATATPESRDRLLREWGPYWDLSKQVLIEKSPPNLVRSRFLQALLPEACFLFIVRHPAAVALATQKWAGTSPVELILHWHICQQAMMADSLLLEHNIILRYEDLVADPQRHLGSVWELAGLDEFAPAGSVQDHNGKYLAAWAEHHVADRDLLLNAFPEVTALAGRLGYSFTEPFVTAVPPAGPGESINLLR